LTRKPTPAPFRYEIPYNSLHRVALYIVLLRGRVHCKVKVN
jgi:hypothetical protein